MAARAATPHDGNAGTGGGGAEPHVIVTVRVLICGLHEDPLGTGPSPTVSITGTIPANVQVKLVLEDVGLENDPLGADHW